MLVNDDVAVENSTHTTGRRGVAGTLIVEKMVGAAAEAGRRRWRECKALGDRVNAATASMGVAFTSCTVPAAGRADLRHRRTTRWRSASASTASRAAGARAHMPADDDRATTLLDAILGDLKPAARPRRCCCTSTASAARR